MQKLSRRGLLRGAAGLAAGYYAGRLILPDGLYPVSADALDAPAVSVAAGTNDDTPEILLRAALAPLGGIGRFVKPGQTVCIKPNATWANKPHTASSTDPELLRALINLIKAAGAKRIIVVDRCTIDPPAMTLAESGIGKILEETRVEWQMHDYNGGPANLYVPVSIPKGKAFKSIRVIKEAVEADVRINMALAKSHLAVPVTMCCKHMMGFLHNPGEIHGAENNAYLDQGIADIGTIPDLKVDLHILEAIRVRVDIRSYGDGTDVTDPVHVKRHNQLIIGTDPVLIDAYAVSKFYSRSPMEITHIKRCFEIGTGEIDVPKATADGRLRIYTPAEALKPTITPTPTITPELAPGERVLTPTPRPAERPTATPAPAKAATGDMVVDLGPTLNGALLPLAAVIGGVGVVVGRRMKGSLRREAGRPEAPAKDPAAGRPEDDDGR